RSPPGRRTQGASTAPRQSSSDSSVAAQRGAHLLVTTLALAPAAAPLAVAAVASAAAVAGPDRGQFLGAFAGHRPVVGESESDPPSLAIHLDHGAVDLVAGAQHVVDRVDPLPRFHVGDVEQAVGALDQLDEGAEGGRLHDFGAVVAVADLGLLGHRLDP